MTHIIETMKYTVQNFGHVYRTSIILLLAQLILLFAGPADARETGRFEFLVIERVDDVYLVIGEDVNNTQIKKKNTVLWSSYPPGMDLNISFFKALNYNNGSGSACFPGSDDLALGYYEGPFVVSQERDGTARVDFYFTALDKNGSVDHDYVLHLFGEFDDYTNFPPAKGPEHSVTMTSPLSWQISTEGKGQSRKVTCTGDGGGFDATVSVTRIDE